VLEVLYHHAEFDGPWVLSTVEGWRGMLSFLFVRYIVHACDGQAFSASTLVEWQKGKRPIKN